MRPLKLAVSTALVAMAVCSVASAQQMNPGRIYAFTSQAKGSCPTIHWHLVVGANNDFTGMLSWNDMKSIARVAGTVNMTAKTFQGRAEEVGGQGRIATVSGQVQDDGWLNANIDGPDVKCDNLNVPWFDPPPPSGG